MRVQHRAPWALAAVLALWATGAQAHPIDITSANVGAFFAFTLDCTNPESNCDDDSSAWMKWTLQSYTFDGTNTLLDFDIDIKNTSNDPGTITAFGFNTNPNATDADVSGSAIFVGAKVDVGGGQNHFDVCVQDQLAFNNCVGGDPQAGLDEGLADAVGLLLTFAGNVNLVTLSDWTVRLQSTGPLGEGSAKLVGQPDAIVPEPGTLMLLGAGLAGGWAHRRRRRARG